MAKKQPRPCLPGSKPLAVAVGLNIPELLKWFDDERPDVDLDAESAREAAKHGWINVLEQCSEAIEYHDDIAILAARYNQLAVMQWIFPYLQYDRDAIVPAAKYGAVDILKWLHENKLGSTYDECDIIAAENGHINVLEYLVSVGAKISTSASYAAASFHQKAVLRWLRANDYLDDESALIGAITSDDTKLVCWVEPNPTKWSDEVYYAISNNTTCTRILFDLIQQKGCLYRFDHAIQIAHDALSSDDYDDGEYDGWDAQYGDNHVCHHYDSD